MVPSSARAAVRIRHGLHRRHRVRVRALASHGAGAVMLPVAMPAARKLILDLGGLALPPPALAAVAALGVYWLVRNLKTGTAHARRRGSASAVANAGTPGPLGAPLDRCRPAGSAILLENPSWLETPALPAMERMGRFRKTRAAEILAQSGLQRPGLICRRPRPARQSRLEAAPQLTAEKPLKLRRESGSFQK